LPAPFVRGQLAQHAVGLLPRGADESAGVDKQDPGLIGVGDRAESGSAEQLRHGVGINGVFGTAKRNEVEGLRGFRCHASFRVSTD
jgi:hypothetical protein